MILTAGQLRFIRDNNVYDIVEKAIELNLAQADVEFALLIKQVHYLEGLVNKR